MKNEISNLNDLKGKTIVDFKLNCGDLWLKFSDNTFGVLVVHDISEPYGYTKNEVNLYEYGKGKTESTLVELGLISKQEYDEACKQQEIEYMERELQYEKERNEKIKQYELEQLEKLKSKYDL